MAKKSAVKVTVAPVAAQVKQITVCNLTGTKITVDTPELKILIPARGIVETQIEDTSKNRKIFDRFKNVLRII